MKRENVAFSGVVVGFLLGVFFVCVIGMLVSDAQADSDGEWRVVIDEKGKSGVLYSTYTGRTLYSHKGTWTNGPFSHWREATASK